MIGAAVVGLGVGAAHARALASIPEARLLRVHDLDPARRQEAERANGLSATPSFQAILEDEAVRLVVIASYDDAHHEQVLAALRAGKHVFVEKPLCRSSEELRAIRAAWTEAGRPLLASNLVLRAAPLYRWLADAIARGELGTVYAVDGDYLYGRLPKITEGWRGRVENYSVMLGGGIHLVDLMIGLTGHRPVTAWACGTNIATRGTAYRYDDFTAATWRFSSGLVGRVTSNYGCVHPHQHVLRVFGTEATVLHDDAGVRIQRGRDAAPRREPLDLAPLPPHKGALLPELIERLREETPTDALAEREFAVLAACFAADESARTGRECPVESF